MLALFRELLGGGERQVGPLPSPTTLLHGTVTQFPFPFSHFKGSALDVVSVRRTAPFSTIRKKLPMQVLTVTGTLIMNGMNEPSPLSWQIGSVTWNPAFGEEISFHCGLPSPNELHKAPADLSIKQLFHYLA